MRQWHPVPMECTTKGRRYIHEATAVPKACIITLDVAGADHSIDQVYLLVKVRSDDESMPVSLYPQKRIYSLSARPISLHLAMG